MAPHYKTVMDDERREGQGEDEGSGLVLHVPCPMLSVLPSPMHDPVSGRDWLRAENTESPWMFTERLPVPGFCTLGTLGTHRFLNSDSMNLRWLRSIRFSSFFV